MLLLKSHDPKIDLGVALLTHRLYLPANLSILWHLVMTRYTFKMQHHYHENNCQTGSWCRQCRL